MIAFIVGTTAELIKIAPVYHEIIARGARPLLWFTGQHVEGIGDVLTDLEMPEPDVWLVSKNAQNLRRPAQVPHWAATVGRNAVARRAELRAALADDGRLPLAVVHGDTFTTPYGAMIGRWLLGARVAHIEAGLRSGSLRSPLPEEVNRRVASRLVDLHFAPTANEVANLRGARGVVIDTGANTVIDSLRKAVDAEPVLRDLPPEFGLATLHRFELLSRGDQFREVLRLLRGASERLPLIYLAGAPERERIHRLGLHELFDDTRFVIRPKLRYHAFLPVLARASFVITDSGGLQEECSYLGVPCAIHRKRTERTQGLSDNALLTGMRTDRLTRFLDTYPSMRTGPTLDRHHPSAIIADTLTRLGFC